MNIHESTPTPNPENLEKLKYFADKALGIRQDFEFVITPICKRLRDILDLHGGLSSKIGMDRTDEIREKMPEPDKSEFLDLENSLSEFNKRVYEFYNEIIGFLAKDSSVQWKKYSLAPDDSYAGNFSQGYSTKLDDNCNIAINWFGYHRKLNSFFNTPEPTEDQKKYLQTQDESYYLVFQDDAHKTIYLNGNDFQLAQRVSEDREFYFPEGVEKSMSQEDFEMLKYNFLALGQRLKEELGVPARELENKTSVHESGPRIPTTEEVISMFKEQGETPESIQKYTLWFTNKQKEASESPGEYAILNFNIEVASLLVEAGMMDDAREYCDGAWVIVDNEVGRVGEENMSEELKKLCDRLNDVCDKII